MIEDAIIENGEAGKKSVINSSRTINILHDVVKLDLIKGGVNSDLIKPSLKSTNPEIQLAGFMKFKTQDVSFKPNS
jgi:hypothetical protein